MRLPRKPAIWGAAILVVLFLIGVWAHFTAAEWAAWVQAVGSVGAILVAVAVARHQSEELRERDEEAHAAEKIRVLEIIGQLVEQADASCTVTEGLLMPGVSERHWRNSAAVHQDLLAQIRSIPTLQVPVADMVRLLILIRQILITFIGYAGTELGRIGAADFREGVRQFAASSRETIQEARELCAQELLRARKLETARPTPSAEPAVSTS